MTLEEKVALLGLKEIDDEFYDEYLAEWDELRKSTEYYDGKSVRDRFHYYKMYGECEFVYSCEYLERTSIKKLVQYDKRNQRQFKNYKRS